jgi:hypothetical protein
MKSNDARDFCMLYIEPADEKDSLFEYIGRQKKPVVILLPVKARSKVFQHPDDFSDLKQVKRQLDLPIVFVVSGNELLRKLAWRNGFPAYVSIDALADSVANGQLAISRQRTLARRTIPLSPLTPETERNIYTRSTGPLEPIPSSVQQSAPKAVPPPQPPPVPVAGSRGRGFPAVLVFMLLVFILGAALLSYFWFPRLSSLFPAAATTDRAVGSVMFLSSDQVSENSDQGIDDEVRVDLHGLSNPATGKSYYAWLLGDQNQDEAKPILLGKLDVMQGNANLLYAGDQQHTNLLVFNSRFVVTEEDSAVTPITPAPNYNSWRYYGEIPQSPDPRNSHHYSFLDHMRHLLASEPMLNELELPGGLNNWFSRNTSKLIEWTTSARDRWEESKDLAFVRRQSLRTLTYLDGLSFMLPDMPPGATPPDTSKPASVGLLDVNGPNQNPASYIGAIVYHLNGLLDAPGSTPAVRQSVSQIIPAIDNVQNWLEKLRVDTKRIVAMNDTRLGQSEAFSLLNDMVDQANQAYAGQVDLSTGAVLEGVAWIHEQLQSLASMTVTKYDAAVSPPEIVPGNNTVA